MDTIKSIAGVLLGSAIFIGVIAATILFFTFGANIAFAIAPFINWLGGVLLITNLFLLVFTILPKTRTVIGIIIYVSSYIYGLSAWIYGLAVTLALWGWIGVIAGLFLGGIGVVPIGMIAALLNGHWGILLTLLLTVLLTYGARIVGYAFANSTTSQNANGDIIDIEPEDTKRIWRDLE